MFSMHLIFAVIGHKLCNASRDYKQSRHVRHVLSSLDFDLTVFITVRHVYIVVGQKLGENVTKNRVHDYPLITISLDEFFIFGFFPSGLLISWEMIRYAFQNYSG